MILPLGFFLGQAAANIIFNIGAKLNCNPNDEAYTGCLRGQRCAEDWT